MRHSGIEYAYILEGELTLQLDFDTYVLGPGDSLQFDSVRPHLYSNKGTTVAQGVWFVVGRRQQNGACRPRREPPRRPTAHSWAPRSTCCGRWTTFTPRVCG